MPLSEQGKLIVDVESDHTPARASMPEVAHVTQQVHLKVSKTDWRVGRADLRPILCLKELKNTS